MADGIVKAGDRCGTGNGRGLSRDGGRLGGNRRCESGQQRVLVKLGEKAVVVRILSLLMQPMVELWGCRECDGSQPERKREPGDGESAGAALPFVCKPMAHRSFT